MYKVEINNLIYNHLKVKNDKLYITGSNPYFQIPSNKYVSLLKLDLDKGSEGFQLYATDDKGNVYQTYNSNSDVKNFVYIKINKNIKNMKFHIKMNNNGKYLGIQSITINNKFYFNIIRFLIVLVVLYLLLALVVYKNFLSKNIHIAFLIISLTLGTLISICVPPYYSYDECAHFIRAYETGSFNFNFSKDKTSKWVSNIDEFFSYTGHDGIYNLYKDRVSNAEIFFNNDYSNIKHVGSPEDTYLFVPYIPSAVGILIGKILRLPFMLTFYLGRVFSLLAYSLLGTLIIKHIKIAKRLIFMILLFPSVLLSAGAYSVDPMTIILSISSMAIFVNMMCAKENSIGYKKIIGLVGCTALTAMCKVPYTPLILVIFAVPNVKFKNYKNGKIVFIKFLSLVPVGLAAAGTFLYGLSKDINQWKIPGVNVKEQILFIVNDLPRYIHVVYNHTATNLLSNIQNSIAALAYCGVIDSIWALAIIISLFTVAFSDDESDILNLGKKEKIIILLSIILSWGLAITALYITFTPVGKYGIDGFQGRYIIPLLLPILLLFKNNKISNKFKKENLNYVIIFEFVFILIITIVKIFLEYNN
ncbi:DUF2142 domain-containing protein [Clostridium arbusti]|uniref:DUF2142 domain-containing protein n=1 Tax=Clostridium arbusti TaxID=1137848 RepID=UPI0002890C4C|nr:DUF2142 domain-containing protein [Clostridium arbusti]